jgi:hypothetical protein
VTDGELAAVSQDAGGQVVELFMLRGTRLAFDGRPVLRAAEPVTVSAHRGAGGWETSIRKDLAPHAAAVEAEAVGLKITAP